MEHRHFEAGCRSDLEKIDQLTDAIARDLENLRAACLVDIAAMGERLRDAENAAAEIRKRVEEAARALSEPIPAWADRTGVEEQVSRLAHALAERAAEVPRRRLLGLADVLGQGRVINRTGKVNIALDEVRTQALREVTNAAQQNPPLELPGPEQGANWLPWAWGTEPSELERLMADVRPALGKLLQLVVDTEPHQWRTPDQEVSPRPVPPPDMPGQRPLPPTPEDKRDQQSPLAESLPPPSEEPIKPRPERKPLPPFDIQPIPDELLFFDTFRGRYWIAPDGRPAEVPWTIGPAFASELTIAARGALQEHQMARLWVFCRAAEELRQRPLFDPQDLHDMAAVLATPAFPAAGTNPERATRFRESFTPLQQTGPGQRLAELQRYYHLPAFLEAIRPSREQPLTPREVDDLLDLLDFHASALRGVVSGLLKLGALGIEPMDRLQSVLRETRTESSEELERRLAQRRVELHQEVRKLWSAAGGKVQRTHCRQAWDEFIEKARPIFEPLFPPENGGSDRGWSVPEMRQAIARLPQVHRKIADKRGAKYQDRKAMDRAANEVADLAARVNEAQARVLEARSNRREEAADLVPTEDARKLQQSQPLAHPDEEWYRQCLLTLLADSPAPADPLAVTEEMLSKYPDLLGVLPPLAGDRAPDWGPHGEHIDKVQTPLQAAAVLLGQPHPWVPVSAEPFLDQFARELKRRGRYDLLGRLTPCLSPTDQKGVHNHRTDTLHRVYADLSRIQQLWSELEGLGYSEQMKVWHIAREAERLLAEADPHHTAEPTLVQFWLRLVEEALRRIRDQLLDALRREIQARGDEDTPELLRALEQGRYADVVGARERGADEGASSPGWRETLWRKSAEDQFRNPMTELSRLRGRIPAVEEWLHPGRGHQKLKTALAKLIFDNPPGHTSSLYKKGDNTRNDRYIVPCREVLDYLADHGLNPCYLPQLHNFGQFAILAPPVPPADSKFVQLTAAAVADKLTLHIVLAPNLQAPTRQGTLRELRKRGLAAALLDDVDLCRLLNPGGRQINLLLGLFEIVLEQMKWAAHSPFKAPEGMQVAMEMYVGRRDEARQLARESTYSRLFSGRKLGKTALLRFIAQTEDGAELPSSLRLRVVYVPVVGVRDESILVRKVFDAVRDKLGFERGVEPTAYDAQAMVSFLQRFTQTHSDTSLLVVLDEADEFVLAQLEEYEAKGTACLSFHMRSEVTEQVDRMGLPRVRFVFAGYQATQRSEGAWANWGEVLRLNPLTADEAAGLVDGPLARLGIDATQQARAIAFRCGYQPAVLLRFGQMLLDRLERTGYREGVVISAEHVAETFNEKAVQEEIYNILRNNFDRNPMGRAIFFSLVLEFAALPPGQGLDQTADRVVQRLKALGGDQAWLRGDDNSARNQVNYQLSDFVKRQLLTEHSVNGEPIHRLKFPYHLPVLLSHNPAEEIRLAVEEIRREQDREEDLPEEERGIRSRTFALLAPRPLENLRAVTHSPSGPTTLCQAAVVASHWPEAITDDRGGVPVRLGFNPVAIRQTGDVGPADLSRDQLAVVGATPATLRDIVERRPAGKPPVLFLGGADLLRWALARQREADEFYEIAALGRLSQRTLRWWFRRVRGLGFYNETDLDVIWDLTGGIPLLVRAVDNLLVPQGCGGGGHDIDPAQMTNLQGGWDNCRREAAHQLTAGTAPWLLTDRELEVLRMLSTTAQADDYSEGTDPAAALGEYWDLYSDAYRSQYPDQRTPSPLADCAADKTAVEALGLLGLVPWDPDRPGPLERLLPLSRDDAILPVLRYLGGPA